MSPCAAQIFSNITAEKWLAIQSKAAQHDIVLSGDSGQATQQGFAITWQYDRATTTLSIQCLEHPVLVTCGMINGRIHDLVEAI